MKVSDDLFQLIRSLDKNERRYFRLFASMQSGSKQYMKLFEAIDAQARYSEEEIRARFADQQFVRQLAVAKNYLYNLILKCLALYHAGYGNQIDRLLQQAQILRSRALYRQALKLVERAERLAEEAGDDVRMLLVLDERRGLLEKVSPTAWSRTRLDHHLRLRQAIGTLSMAAVSVAPDEIPVETSRARDAAGTTAGIDAIAGRAMPARKVAAKRGTGPHPAGPPGAETGAGQEEHGPGNGRAGGEARIEILREMLLEAVDTGAAGLAAEARRELQAMVSSETRADAIRLTAAAALEIASLLEELRAGQVTAEPAAAIQLLAREGGRLVVRDLLQIELLILLHHLRRGDMAAALAGATELRAHPELPAYPGLRVAAAVLVPILRSKLGDRRGADGALAAAGRALSDTRTDACSPDKLVRALADTLGATDPASRRERFISLRRSIPPITELPGLPAVLDRVLAELAELD